MKIAKMANYHCCIPLCNNDKCYNSGEDLCYFNFPKDGLKQKQTPSLECIIYFEFCLCKKWGLRDKLSIPAKLFTKLCTIFYFSFYSNAVFCHLEFYRESCKCIID